MNLRRFNESIFMNLKEILFAFNLRRFNVNLSVHFESKKIQCENSMYTELQKLNLRFNLNLKMYTESQKIQCARRFKCIESKKIQNESKKIHSMCIESKKIQCESKRDSK